MREGDVVPVPFGGKFLLHPAPGKPAQYALSPECLAYAPFFCVFFSFTCPSRFCQKKNLHGTPTDCQMARSR